MPTNARRFDSHVPGHSDARQAIARTSGALWANASPSSPRGTSAGELGLREAAGVVSLSRNRPFSLWSVSGLADLLKNPHVFLSSLIASLGIVTTKTEGVLGVFTTFFLKYIFLRRQ